MSAGAEVIERSEMADFLPDNLPQRTGEVEAEVARAKAQAEAVQVTNEAEAQVALELSKEINRRRKAIEEESKALRKPRRDAADEIKRRYDGVKAPFDEADKIVREKLATFKAEQDRKRREEEERLERERQERERVAREARERAEAAAREAQRKAEDEVREAEELAEADPEMAGLVEETRAQADEAQVTSDAIASLPEIALPQQAPAPTPKLDGFTTPKRWVATVVDFDALPDKLPDGTPLKVVDEAALRRWMYAQVKAKDGVAPELPGAEFKQVEGTAVRT